jgi:hypothetical protein
MSEGKNLRVKAIDSLPRDRKSLGKGDCSPDRDIPRTWNRILNSLTKLNAAGQLADLSTVAAFQRSEYLPR